MKTNRKRTAWIGIEHQGRSRQDRAIGKEKKKDDIFEKKTKGRSEIKANKQREKTEQGRDR